jgi:2-(3-amino-3-carboxypropyl)histidine synthase
MPLAVPIDATTIKMLYVFVDIQIDIQHFVDSVTFNIPPKSSVAMVSTIQFSAALHGAKLALDHHCDVTIPQAKPLSPGEVLGCTAPRLLQDHDALMCVPLLR